MEDFEYGTPAYQVWCTVCKKWKTVKDVEFLGVSEDERGRDLLEFQCPECLERMESNVVLR